MLNLLIDRVGNVNIFNVLDSSLSHSKSHLKSKMDDDLIQEYIKEIENVSRISHSILSKSQISDFRPDILKDLKILGETFFDQFFPQEIVERFKTTNDKYLHFNIDTGLKDIPWELLHDGQTFLSDRFYIGKTVKGSSTPEPNPDSKKLQMLIIVDPNEDLEWAQREGELLFKILKEKIPSSVLDLHFIAGKQISKMKLLSMIRGKHIIHYSGHLYFSDDPMENGWLLANEKVLKAREIKNCGFSSNLVFSNSCHSAKSSDSGLTSSIMNYFAGSFLMSGIKCFIGTNWHVLDNENTLDFTIRFYLSLFNSKSVGEALHSAREYARRNYDSCDLTWANYTLHGLPEYVILSTKSELKKSVIDSDTIRVKYPTPIARSYINFLSREENQESFPVLLEVLISSFENLSKLVGAIVFSDHINQSLGRINKIPKVEITLSKWWDMIFSSMWDFKKLEISLVMDTFMETLSINRELIYKMIDWTQKFRSGQIPEDFMQGYLVTFQYYYENLLVELSELENVAIVYLHNIDKNYFFEGMIPSIQNLNKNGLEILEKKSTDFAGGIVLYHKTKKQVLPLKSTLSINKNGDEFELLTESEKEETVLISY